MLYRPHSFTDLYQTRHQCRVPGEVVTYCFWWKSGIRMFIKPEVELIFAIVPIENCLMSDILKMVRDTTLDSQEVR